MPNTQIQINRNFRRLFVALGVVGLILVVAVVLIGVWNQHSSCLRSNEIRHTTRKMREVDAREARWLRDHGRPSEAAFIESRSEVRRELHPLNCSLPLPEE